MEAVDLDARAHLISPVTSVTSQSCTVITAHPAIADVIARNTQRSASSVEATANSESMVVGYISIILLNRSNHFGNVL